ncbi:MAG: CHC2 zinc finger domain-containing protein [Pseudomonadota bacterium]
MTWIDFQAVRDGLRFDDVLEHFGFDIRPNGKDQVKVHCPFHEDANPSCGINLTKKVFHCFSCQAKGNVLDFYASMEGFDASDTRQLRKAAIRACETFDIDGGTKPEAGSKRPKAKQAKAVSTTERLRSKSEAGLKKPRADVAPKAGQQSPAPNKKPKALTATRPTVVASNDNADNAADNGHSKRADNETTPVNAPLTFELQLDANPSYLRERVIDGKPISKQLIEEFGLGVARRGSMKDRLCFPIHNEAGELIAYSGRWIWDDLPNGTPRYKLPKGFEKRLVLFNLNRVLEKREQCADAGDEPTDSIVIVEGFWSVIRLHSLGIPVVSTFGDSVSEEQADLLVQAGFSKALLIFDGDTGGRAGTQQALPVLATRLFAKALMLDDGDKPDTMSQSLINQLPRYRRSP